MKDLTISQLTMLQIHLKEQLDNDIFGEFPELRIQYSQVKEAIYIHKIKEAISSEDLEDLISLKTKIEKIFRKAPHISEKLNDFYKRLQFQIDLLGGDLITEL